MTRRLAARTNARPHTWGMTFAAAAWLAAAARGDAAAAATAASADAATQRCLVERGDGPCPCAASYGGNPGRGQGGWRR